MSAKQWWTSKTLWLNIIAGGLAIIQAIQGQAWIPPQYEAAIVAVLNIIVRLLTNQPIAGTPAAKQP